jgi:hypothetical protein
VGRRDLRATLIGEAGTALALVLAGIAALTTFVAAAGPRELASEQIAATRRAADLVSDLQRAIYASAYWFPTSESRTAPTLAQQATVGKALIKGMPQPIQPDARGARVWITGPLYQLVHAAPQAVLLGQPFMQVSYDSELPTDCRLLAGRLLTAITAPSPAVRPRTIRAWPSRLRSPRLPRPGSRSGSARSSSWHRSKGSRRWICKSPPSSRQARARSGTPRRSWPIRVWSTTTTTGLAGRSSASPS